MLDKSLPDVHESIDKGIEDVSALLENSRNTVISLRKTISWKLAIVVAGNCSLRLINLSRVYFARAYFLFSRFFIFFRHCTSGWSSKSFLPISACCQRIR